MLKENILINSGEQEASQDLDPLGVDAFMVHNLPVFNKNGGSKLINATAQILEGRSVAGFSVAQAQAAIRDLGMIAASLQRHGINLVAVPGLEKTLLSLSAITREVPRDTVYSYGLRNPLGHRLRTFTGGDGERLFINCFSEGLNGLLLCSQKLLCANSMSVSDPSFIDSIAAATSQFRKMVEAMANVRNKITPEYFTFELRPYFEPLTIGGKTYMAPGGAQMPLILVDRVLWGVTSPDSTYQSYFEDNLKYLPPVQRAVAQSIVAPSLVDKVATEPVSVSTVEALDQLLREIYKFRAPHRKTAEENFRLRPNNSKGSGGYSEMILDVLIDETLEARKRLRR